MGETTGTSELTVIIPSSQGSSLTQNYFSWSFNMAMDDSDATLFPQKLMDILADPLNHDAISWLPNGKAFVILDRDQFFESVMPKYFSRKAKYSSFTRKLNRWYVREIFIFFLFIIHSDFY
jgi:HSF-type DNA-binding